MDTLFRGLRVALWLCCGLGLAGLAAAQSACVKWQYIDGSTGFKSFDITAVLSEISDEDNRATSASDPRFTSSLTLVGGAPSMPPAAAGAAPMSLNVTMHRVVRLNGNGYQDYNVIMVVSAQIATDPNCGPDTSCASNANKPSTVNWTWGYTTLKPDSTEAAANASNMFPGSHPKPVAGDSSCDVNNCKVDMTGATPVKAWQSLTPTAQGMYRMSIDYEGRTTGANCAANGADTSLQTGSGPIDPNQPPPNCNGAVGQVNGVTTCVPSATGNTVLPPGTPGAVSGNPPAGEYDSGASDGSRTPANGSGSASGGPASAGNGSAIGPAPAASAASAPGTSASAPASQNADDCSVNPSGTNCGGNPADIGTLYTAKTATFDQALANFKSTVSASPLFAGVGGFFSVTGGGSCPTWSWTIPYLNAPVVLDELCGDMGRTITSGIAAMLLVVAGFMAFKVAIGD